MKVVAIRGDVCGVSHHRMLTPISEILRQELAEVRGTADMLPIAIEPTASNAAVVTEMYNALCSGADLLHTQRVKSQELVGLMTALSIIHGLPYCMDIDDDIVNIDQSNPAYNAYRERTDDECYDIRKISDPSECQPGEIVGESNGEMVAVRQLQEDGRAVSMHQVTAADAIFTTTRDLAMLYGNVRKSHKHIYVLPNSLLPDEWDTIEAPGGHAGEVWVGWAGSTSHSQDIHMLVDLAEFVLGSYRNTKFFWQKLPHPRLMRLASEYPERCVMYDGWARPEDYPDFYKAMDFDIALGPLVDTPFNRAKSNLKWLEAGICSQAFVCSRVGPYAHTVHNKVDGILCSSARQWRRACADLIESQTMREQIGSAARERVLREFNMTINCKLWIEAYEAVARELGDKAKDRSRACLTKMEA